MKKNLILKCVLGFAFLAAGCGASQDEVARVNSPDRKLDAVLVEINGGATTSFGYKVYIVEKGVNYNSGNSVASLYGAVRNSSAYGVNLVWKSAKELEVQYLSAKDSNIESSSVVIAGSKIAVFLRPGISDPTAPSGGMLYNLEKHEKSS